MRPLLTYKNSDFCNPLKTMDLREKHNMLWFYLTAQHYLTSFLFVLSEQCSEFIGCQQGYQQGYKKGKMLWQNQLQ